MAHGQGASNQSAIAMDVFHSLRIPDAVKDLPTFDGNPRLLYDFLTNVEEILSLMPQLEGSTYEKIILRAVRNKIIGEANEVLNLYGTPVDWNQIKNNLILHYSDKRNETSLIRDLHQMRQGQSTLEHFYSKIIDILSAMTNHVNVHERDANVITAKLRLYGEMCLNTFLSGLKEPLGSTVRSMRPSKLAEAYYFCLQEQNCHYFRDPQRPQPLASNNRNTNRPVSNNFPSRPFNSNIRNSPRPTSTNFQSFSGQNPTNSATQTFPFNHPNNFQPTFHTNNNSNPYSFNKQLPPPEPMDTYSGNTNRNSRHFSHNNNSIRSRKHDRLYNIEGNNYSTNNINSPRPMYPDQSNNRPVNQTPDYVQGYYQHLDVPETSYQNTVPEIDDSNFPLTASQNQWDT